MPVKLGGTCWCILECISDFNGLSLSYRTSIPDCRHPGWLAMRQVKRSRGSLEMLKIVYGKYLQLRQILQ